MININKVFSTPKRINEIIEYIKEELNSSSSRAFNGISIDEDSEKIDISIIKSTSAKYSDIYNRDFVTKTIPFETAGIGNNIFTSSTKSNFNLGKIMKLYLYSCICLKANVLVDIDIMEGDKKYGFGSIYSKLQFSAAPIFRSTLDKEIVVIHAGNQNQFYDGATDGIFIGDPRLSIKDGNIGRALLTYAVKIYSTDTLEDYHPSTMKYDKVYCTTDLNIYRDGDIQIILNFKLPKDDQKVVITKAELQIEDFDGFIPLDPRISTADMHTNLSELTED